MKNLRLYSEAEYEYVEVPVSFIDTFMPEASEEELKVYLYIKRALMDSSVLLSLQDMADLFDVTPKKVLQALLSWEKKGVLSLSWSDGELSGITLLKEKPASYASAGRETESESRSSTAPAPAVPAREMPDNVMQLPKPEKKAAAPDVPMPTDLSVLDTDEQFAEILSLAEYLTKMPINWRMREALGTSYLLFDRDPDVVEYLIEYCVEQHRSSAAYILSVARGWKKEGLSDLQEIRDTTAARNHNVYSIKKAFGIRNRELVRDELDYIEKWLKLYDLPMVLEAIRRTMEQADKPSFKYADSIIQAWAASGVKTLEDAEARDKEFHEEKNREKQQKEPHDPPVKKTAFHNFDERHTDYNALVRKLLES